jgi:hypothetical protein
MTWERGEGRQESMVGCKKNCVHEIKAEVEVALVKAFIASPRSPSIRNTMLKLISYSIKLLNFGYLLLALCLVKVFHL